MPDFSLLQPAPFTCLSPLSSFLPFSPPLLSPSSLLPFSAAVSISSTLQLALMSYRAILPKSARKQQQAACKLIHHNTDRPLFKVDCCHGCCLLQSASGQIERSSRQAFSGKHQWTWSKWPTVERRWGRRRSCNREKGDADADFPTHRSILRYTGRLEKPTKENNKFNRVAGWLINLFA